MRGFKRCGDVGAGAEAGVDEALLAKPVERGGVMLTALRLDQHGLGPSQSKPVEVLEDAVHIFRPAARLVEIFDPQQEPPARLDGAGMADDGAVGVAQMQPPGG